MFGCRLYCEQGQAKGWPSIARIRRAVRRARGQENMARFIGAIGALAGFLLLGTMAGGPV